MPGEITTLTTLTDEIISEYIKIKAFEKSQLCLEVSLDEAVKGIS